MTQNYFGSGGAGYARHRPDYPLRLAAALADLCPRQDHALDVGCGTGQLSGLLAAHFGQVTALDPSASQIANAAPHRGLRYLTGSAEHLPVADGSVDLVVAAQAAHWFDLPAFYAEARRVGRKGAVLALISYGVPVLDDDMSEAFRCFYWGDLHRYWPADRRHVEERYASLPFPFARCDLPQLAITRDWSFDDFAGYVATWSAAKRACEAGEKAVVSAALSGLRKSWGTGPRRVIWPLTVLAGRLDEAGR